MFVEEMLTYIAQSDTPLKIGILRYFNPVGSHESGLLGEDPRSVPNNLMSYILQVAAGRRPFLNVYGNDYPTPDGTGVRDYVHVVDLAGGHLRALERLSQQDFIKVNLGTGRGSSVLELVGAFARASGQDIPIVFAPRRPGDIASYYASPDLAETELGWKAERHLNDMYTDAWRWQKLNPNGFGNE